MFNVKKVLPEVRQRRWFYCVMGILFFFYPYMFANAIFPALHNSNIYFYLVLGILLFIKNLSSIHYDKTPRVLYYLFILMTIGCYMSYLANGGQYYFHKIVILFASINLIVFVNNKIGLTIFYRLYNKWILLMAILGTIGFIIAFMGVPPVFSFHDIKDNRVVSSWVITFSKQGLSPTNFIRYAGFFDEPGAMGYWGMFALAINKLFIKNDKLEKTLLILLVFTFSMGYIAQSIFYCAFFFLIKSKSKTKILTGLTLLILFFFLYSSKGTENEVLYDATIGRFEQASEGTELLEGTSRERLTELAKAEWQKNPIWGNGQPKDGEYMADNPYETLAFDGIVGTIYLYFPYLLLLYWGIRDRNYDLIGVVCFCALAVFHRPIQANLLTYFVFYSIPTMYALKKNSI